MKYIFMVDRGLHEYIKKRGYGGVSTFIYYAINYYLDYIEHVDANTMLEEIVKINLINLNKRNSKTTACRITRRQLERLATLKKYAKLSKIVNRAIQFYIEKVYGAKIDLEAIRYRHGVSCSLVVGEESLKKINKLKHSREIEKAIKNYIQYFEGLNAMGKLEEIAKINSVVDAGKRKRLNLCGMGIQDLRRFCERYGLKVMYTLIRATEWYIS